VGGKAGALLVAHVDDFELALGKHVIKAQHVIAWYAEDMAHTMSVKAVDQISPDGVGLFHGPDHARTCGRKTTIQFLAQKFRKQICKFVDRHRSAHASTSLMRPHHTMQAYVDAAGSR